jgi:hypothetical protein
VVKRLHDSSDDLDVGLCLLRFLAGMLGVSIDADMRMRGTGKTFWADLTRIASEQLVLTAIGTAVERLTDPPQGADEAIIFFHDVAETNRKRNLWLLDQLDEALRAITAAGIPVLVVKGGAFLLEDRHGGAPWRFFGDLDLLVPEQHLMDGVAALKAIGYVDPGRAYHPAHHRHYPFLSHPGGQTGIDLHTRLAGVNQSVLLDPGRIFDRASRIAVPGGEVLIPCATDRMAHLIANAQILDYRYERRLFRLRDTLDFARLLRRGDLDMGEIRQRFEAYGRSKPLLAYLGAMGNVLGSIYRAPPEAAAEAWWLRSASRIIEEPRRARFHVIRHWLRMLAETLSDSSKRRLLFTRLLDPEQRAEFVGRRLSYWQIFRR